MIDRNSPIPIYYQLKLLLKQQILDNVLQPGAQLPTEQDFCQIYMISRAPVRQALTELVQEGFIYRRPGIGTFVADPNSTSETIPPTRFRLLANDMRWVSLLERTVNHWNATRPKHPIKLEVELPEASRFHQTLRSATVQGNAPDLVSIDYVWLTGYARSAYLTSIQRLDPEWAAWMQSELEAPVRDNHAPDGVLSGIPMQADVTGLWYRRDWFETEGLKPPQSWTEWLTLLEYFNRSEIKQRYHYQYPLAFPCSLLSQEAAVNIFFPFIWMCGGDLLTADGELTLASPEVYQALAFLQSLAQQYKYLPPDSADFHWWDVPRLLAKGQVPMTLGGSYEWPVICEESGWESEEELLQHLAFVPVPPPVAGQRPVVSLGGTTWVIPEQSDHKELSLALVKEAITSTWITDFYAESFQISPYKSINQRLAAEHPWMQTLIPLLEIARPRPLTEQYVRISRFLLQMFEKVVWEGAPVQETVEEMADYLKLLLAG